MNNTERRRLWAAGAAAGSVALIAAGPGPASAHVSVAADRAAAGSTALVSFSLAHGCDGSPTTKLAIKMPEGVNAVAPTVHPGWTVSKVMAKLATPVEDQHGTTVTERVAQVVYTAKTPLPDGYRDSVTVSVPLPQDSAGQVLAFPVVQTCLEGETAWIDLAAAGQEPDELDTPAPTITVTAAEEEDHHHDTGAAEAAEAAEKAEADHQEGVPADEDATTTVATAGGSSAVGLGVAGFVAGLAGLLMGAVALRRGRPRTR